MTKTVLVTGATGYIGSHVCKALKESGYIVHGWDSHVYGHTEANDIQKYCDELVTQDITKPFVKQSYDTVIHLAALISVSESVKIPTEYYRVNALGTYNILQHIDTDHFIFSGTSAIKEASNPYARSKLVAEDIIREYSDKYTILHFYNVSGTNRIFRQIGPSSHLIKVAAEVAVGKRPHIEIYGNDYNTIDGTCMRNYIHVVDVAQAVVNAVDKGPSNTPYESICGSFLSSVKEVLNVMRKVTGKNIPEVIYSRRPGDPEVSELDTPSSLLKEEKTLYDMCLDQYILELNKG